MSKNDIQKALDEAIAHGVRLRPINDPAYVAMYGKSMPILSGPEAVNLLSRALEADSALEVYKSAWLRRIGGGGSAISYRDVAEWMLRRRLNGIGAEDIVDRVFEFASDGTAECWQVHVLNGIRVDHKIDLESNLLLLPFSDLPDDPVKYMFNERGAFGHFNAHCCIVKQHKIRALLGKADGEQPSTLLQAMDHRDQGLLLDEVRRALSLIGPCAPILLGQTAILIDAPGSGNSGGAGGTPHEINVSREPQHVIGAEAQSIVHQYLNLSIPKREKLHVGIDRLNLALRRVTTIDQAIELGIALESLLAEDRGSNDPISFPLRLRGAWLIGETFAERSKVERLLNRLYELRSAAVHSGTLKSRDKGKKRNRIEIEANIKDGCTLCAMIIRKLIELNLDTAWDSLILGGPAKLET